MTGGGTSGQVGILSPSCTGVDSGGLSGECKSFPSPHCSSAFAWCSNWAGDVVALRAVDIAPALVPLASHQPAGAAGPSSTQQAQQARLVGREVLLCTARPLFLATSPNSTRLLWHGNSLEWGMCDAATQVSEDGAEHDCFFANARDCRCQVGAAHGGWAGQAGRRLAG